MATTTTMEPPRKRKVKTENDYWDLEEMGLSLTNMNSELERLKNGEKINILNVGYDELLVLFTGLDMSRIIDTILKQNNPLQILPGGQPYQGTTTSNAMSPDMVIKPKLSGPEEEEMPEALEDKKLTPEEIEVIKNHVGLI